MKSFKPLVLTALAALVCASAMALTHLNTDELLLKSDVVLLGEVISVDQGVQASKCQIRALQVYKGPHKAGELVTVETQGGRVYINEEEPTFMTLQVNLMFLQKTDHGTYISVNQADGQKIVRGRNIYPYHDNLSYSVPLKDYLEGLDATIKAVQAAVAGQSAAATPK